MGKTLRLLFLFVGLAGCAAAQSTRTSLDALEQQRDLFRTYDQAIEGERDLLVAGQCLARMSKLPTRVPLPFQSTTLSAEDLRKRARDLLLRSHAKDEASIRRQSVQDRGRTCTDCGGAGVRRCPKCDGHGRGAVGSASFCPAWNACETCASLGRLGLPEGGSTVLASAWSLVERLAAEADPTVAIRDALSGLPKDVPLLALPRDGDVGKLWEALGAFPCDPVNLPSARKTRLRTVWRAAPLEGRRNFLFDLAQHLLDLERQLAFLGDGTEGSSALARSNEFLRVPMSDLELLTCDFLQGAVEVELTLGNDVRFARGGIESPLSTFVSLEGIDPRLLCAYLYTPEDQELFRTLAKSGVGPDREALLTGYPFATLHKRLAALKSSAPVLLRGTIQRLAPGGPLYGFEIWEVEALKAGEDKR